MMKTITAAPKFQARIPEAAIRKSAPMRRIGRLFHAIKRVIDLLTKWIQLVQAFNELERLDARTLRDIGCRKGELDRILQGHRPRPAPRP